MDREMETIKMTEFLELFDEEHNGLMIGEVMSLEVFRSNVNVVTFEIDKMIDKITKSTYTDILYRVESLTKSTNVLTIKEENIEKIVYYIFCRNDENLKKINCKFYIGEHKIADLKTFKDTRTHNQYHYIPNPTKKANIGKNTIISKYDVTKLLPTDSDIINLFKSNFDFNIKYDIRDKGYILSYISANKSEYESSINRNKSYELYVKFCNMNYINTPLNKKNFGIMIKRLCSIKQKWENDKYVKKYILNEFGSKSIDDPEIYFRSLSVDNNYTKGGSDKDMDSFKDYFNKSRDSYLTCEFTKVEAYEDYLKFCTLNNYRPLPKKDFYTYMLDNCVIKRSRNKNRAECFVLQGYQYDEIIKYYMKRGIPEWMDYKQRSDIEKIISRLVNSLN